MSTTELQTSQKPESPAKVRQWRRPHYDISENGDAFEVRVSVPGVNREGIDISVNDEVLTLEATRSEAIPDGWKALRRELPQGDYRLALRLNIPIDDEAIKAQVTDGILHMTLPKAEAVKPRKIQVN